MTLPGQVENWVVISDFEKNGFGDLSLGSIKQVMSVLTDNYRCRLGVNYVVNPAKSVYYIWTCVKPFLDDVLIDKVKLLNGSVPTELFTHINPFQVEEKYGGKAPNLTRYWPPHVPNAPYSLHGIPQEERFEGDFNKSDKSAGSEMIDMADTEHKHNRLSVSRDELALRDDFDEKNENFREKIENNIFTNEPNIKIIENFAATGIDYSENAEENKEIYEKQERKRLRKEKRAKRHKKKLANKELEKEIPNSSEIYECPPPVELKTLEIRPLQEVSVDENEKTEVGCEICSGFSMKPFSRGCVII